MATFNIPVDQISVLLFIFLRVTSILFFLPIFDSPSIPAFFKIGLSLTISLLFLPLLKLPGILDFAGGIPLLIGIASEIIMGVGIGLCVRLIFSGIQLGGQIVGYQMGLAIANVFDPSTGTQNSVIAQFQYMAAMLIFLCIDGHHMLLQAVTDSFHTMPPFGFHPDENLLVYFLSLVGNMFIIALKVSAPIIVAMLFTSVSLGLVARTVPQINIFFVAMPIKLLLGYLFIGMVLPIFTAFVVKLSGNVGDTIMTFIRLGAG